MTKRPFFLYVSLADRLLFAKHLAIMIKAGMPLVEALKLLRKQARSKPFLFIINSLIGDVENGQFLSASLNKFRNVFGELFINVVKVGESTGSLSENLTYLALESKKQQILRNKVKAALIYPAVIFMATLGVTFVLLFFVFPKIMPIFTSLKINLPLSTRVLIGASKFLLSYGVWVIVGFIVLIAAFAMLLKIPTFRYFIHRFLILKTPVVKSISKQAAMSHMCRTLGLLLKSGIKIVEAVNITADSIPNLVYRARLKEAVEYIKRGHALHEYLVLHEDVFLSTVTRMIEVGEMTGTLDEHLFYLAEFYEEEVDEALKTLSNTLEPLLLVVMGLLVGFMALAIITPIYSITQNLKTR